MSDHDLMFYLIVWKTIKWDVTVNICRWKNKILYWMLSYVMKKNLRKIN